MEQERSNNVDKLYVFVEKMMGPDARRVFEVLYQEGEELSEYDIMEKTELRGSVVRRALNMLAEKGLVTYRRLRHPDKGRLIFYWKVNYEGLPAVIEARKRAALERLKYLLEREEETQYYICPLDKTRYTFEEALEYEFTCPRCGEMLVPDSERDLRIEILRQYVRLLEADRRASREGGG